MQRYFIKNKELKLEESDIRHIKKVMRMNINDLIEVVYNNKLYIYRINNLEPFEINLVEEVEESDYKHINLTVAVALVKEQKMDLILQKLTELGVSKIIPVSMERSIVKLNKDRFNKKKARWESICKEASEQSKRNDIPTIKNIHKIEDLVKIEADLKLVLDTKENFKTIKNVLHNHPTCDKIIIVIGPEGGITKEEITYLHKHGYQSVSLGENILRSETAAIAALSMLNYHYLR